MKAIKLIFFLTVISHLCFSQNFVYENGVVHTNSPVGIGTDNPQDQLQVDGRIRLMPFTNGSGVWYQSQTSNDWFVGLDNSDQFRIFNTDTKLLMTTSGYLGLGTSTPQAMLDVHGNIYAGSQNASGKIIIRRFSDLGNAGSIGFDANDGLDFQIRSQSGGGSISLYTNHTSGTTERMRIMPDGKIGIGTSNPNYELDLQGLLATGKQGLSGQIIFRRSSDGNTSAALGYTGPTEALNFGIRSSSGGGFISFSTNDGVGSGTTEKMRIFPNGNVGIGTTTSNNFKLSVNGDIRAKEIKVETGWSDFVFEDDYNLRSLEEVEEFIHANKHLPDIPSAKEVEENGVDVGAMESKLLQKIEELTLYIIQQEKRIKTLESKLEN